MSDSSSSQAVSKRGFKRRISDAQGKGAMGAVLEELFQDMYRHRWQIYRMNFVRGLLFGLGGAIGSTLAVALLLWGLSFFQKLPFIGDIVQAAGRSLEQQNPQQ